MIFPTPQDIREARLEVGLSQSSAAKIVHVSESTWQRWETHVSFDSYVLISGSAWELFLISTHNLRPADSPWRVRDRFLKRKPPTAES